MNNSMDLSDHINLQLEQQPTINIGMIGHVSHGKSTLVKALSGIKTGKYDKEIVNNMTIKLGYANAKIWFCNFCKHYFPSGSEFTTDTITCATCDGECVLKKHISLIDCPGHEILMATMLNGAAIMDAALLVIGADTICPQPQTMEHLCALDIIGIDQHIIAQNKIDIVTQEQAIKNYDEIKTFIKDTNATSAPIIPICANKSWNIDELSKYIANLSEPSRNMLVDPLMIIVRSFDINRPNDPIPNLKGCVLGGSILQGVLMLDQEIEIRPGRFLKIDNKFICYPLRTIIQSLCSEKTSIEMAYPGGLIGVGTNIDPSFGKGDGLVGQILGIVGTLPPVYIEIEINYFILPRAIGLDDDPDKDVKVSHTKLDKLRINEVCKLNIGSFTTEGTIKSLKADLAKITLKYPTCIINKSKIAISRKLGKNKRWRLIGIAQFQTGTAVECQYINKSI